MSKHSFKRACVLYWAFWILYGLLPSVVLFWLWKFWSPSLKSLSSEDIKYARNVAIILGITYWLVSFVLWILAGYISLAWFMQKSNAIGDSNFSKVERAIVNNSNEQFQDNPGKDSSSSVNEMVCLRKDPKSYSSISESPQNLQSEASCVYHADVQLEHRAFRSKSDAGIFSQDMWEDDVLKIENEPSTVSKSPNSQIEVDKKLLVRRTSDQDSFRGLPHLKSFDNYLHLATIDSPLTARELFFIDLIRIADEKERLEALQQLDLTRRPSIELIDIVGACSKDRRDSVKLETIHEVRIERDRNSDDEQFKDSENYLEKNKFPPDDDKFLPVSGDNLEDCSENNYKSSK